ncbi:PAS domain-containing protein, partial [Rhodopirellula bahusiensis]
MESLRKAVIADELAEAAAEQDSNNQRVVAFAPTPQDARLCAKILTENDVSVCCCETIDSFAETLLKGAGIALIAQEHLTDDAIAQLKIALDQQPTWSEVPILVLLQAGDPGSKQLKRILSLEHVTLINRPLRIAVFINTVQAKLRDRLRQFEVRDLLLEKDRTQTQLRREARRLDMAVQAGGMAPWEWSKTHVYWSDAFRRLHGFGKDVQPSESAMFASIVEEERDEIARQWSEAIEQNVAFRSEFRINHPKHGERWLVAVGEPIKSKSGKTLRYTGLQWDITERKTSEMELRQSHETFQRLITENPQGLYVVDADFCVRYVSAGARSVFVNVDPLIGRPFDEAMNTIWPKSFADEAIRHFRHTLDTGEPYVAPPLVEQRADTSETEAYDWSIERIVLPDNRYGVVCHFYNNTRRQQSVDLLRESERYFREIADASPAMLWVTDKNHMCTFLSKNWYDTTGQTQEEGMGLGWTNATHPDDHERVGQEFLGAAEAREPFSSEYRLQRADGSYRWAVDVGRPRFDSEGAFVGYTGYVIDVDDRKAFEQSLEQAKVVAENA